MRIMTIAYATALLIGGAAVLTFAAPAFAATGPTPVTVEVSAGVLAISVPVGADLGTVSASASAQPVTALLGPVLVTDARGGILGWVTSAGSTDFTGAGAIPAAAMTYTPGQATVVGIASVAPTNLTAMTAGGGTVQTASSVTGVNTATWNPSIVVTIPAGAVAGTYHATITHSVS
jgi:hypothetical protein